MNLTAQEAALAWAQGKRVEAIAKNGFGSDAWRPIPGYWDNGVFGVGDELFQFRLVTDQPDCPVTEATPVDDGGPAFPVPPVGTGDPRDGMSRGHDGMTLREYFAAQALAGMMASGSSHHAKAVAKLAVEYADALLAELRKGDK